MPSIEVAMVRSVQARRTLLDVVAAAVQPVVMTRDVTEKITDAKTAFSSWDNCMKADFCKWPVIAIIIVGGLFLLSIVWCIARCACCGMSCCCECCYCLKCCGDCCGCCDPPRNKRNKYLDEPYVPPNQGYRSEAPMTTGFVSSAKPPIVHQQPPQFATFDVSKTANHGNEDALPVMPSWETANTTKVYVEEEEVEMDNLAKPKDADQTPGRITGQTTGQTTGRTVDQSVPLMAATVGRRSPGSLSPLGSPNNLASPYGPPRMPQAANNMNGSHPAVSNGYLATGATLTAADPYGRGSPGAYHNDRHSDVSELGADHTHDYGYSAPAIGSFKQTQQPYDNPPQQTGYVPSPPPGQQRGQGYGQTYQGGSYDDYRRNGPGMPGGQQSYGADHASSNIQELDSGDSIIPSGPSYGAGARSSPSRYDNSSPGWYEPGPSPSGNYTPNSRPLNARPPPQRQYTGTSAAGNSVGNAGSNTGGNGYNNSHKNYGNNYGNSYGNNYDNNYSNGNSSGYGRNGTGASTGYGAPVSPPLQNNGGFDFNSNGSQPMNSTTSPPPLAQPQPDRGYANYGGYRGM